MYTILSWFDFTPGESLPPPALSKVSGLQSTRSIVIGGKRIIW